MQVKQVNALAKLVVWESGWLQCEEHLARTASCTCPSCQAYRAAQALRGKSNPKRQEVLEAAEGVLGHLHHSFHGPVIVPTDVCACGGCGIWLRLWKSYVPVLLQVRGWEVLFRLSGELRCERTGRLCVSNVSVIGRDDTAACTCKPCQYFRAACEVDPHDTELLRNAAQVIAQYVTCARTGKQVLTSCRYDDCAVCAAADLLINQGAIDHAKLVVYPSKS